MRKSVTLLLALVLAAGCVVKFRGQPLVSLDPSGNVVFTHPETVPMGGTNVISHD